MIASTPKQVYEQIAELRSDVNAKLTDKEKEAALGSLKQAEGHVDTGLKALKAKRSNANKPESLIAEKQNLALSYDNLIADVLLPVFEPLAKVGNFPTPEVGPYPLRGTDRESHHVPAAELGSIAMEQYEKIAQELDSAQVSGPDRREQKVLDLRRTSKQERSISTLTKPRRTREGSMPTIACWVC